jgi:hypothetical protein
MIERPTNVVIASAAALAGAFFAALAAIMVLINNADGIATSISFCLLSLVLFLGVFGSLNTNGQWSWKFLIFATAFCAAVPIIAYIYGSLDLLFAAILAILAIVTLILVTTGNTEEWVETDRL